MLLIRQLTLYWQAEKSRIQSMQQSWKPLKVRKVRPQDTLTADPAVLVYGSAEKGRGRRDLIVSVL